MTALPFLQDQFTQEEAQEIADVAKDAAAERDAPLMVVWAVEEAVLNAFGYTNEDDE